MCILTNKILIYLSMIATLFAVILLIFNENSISLEQKIDM